MDAEKLVKAYIRIRDARAEAKKAFENQDAELEEKQDKIEAALLGMCNETGTKALSTAVGTASKVVKTRYWASDWEKMHAFVKDHDAMHLLEKRIAQTAMKEFLEANPESMPEGLNVDSKYSIVVRRK